MATVPVVERIRQSFTYTERSLAVCREIRDRRGEAAPVQPRLAVFALEIGARIADVQAALAIWRKLTIPTRRRWRRTLSELCEAS